MYSPQDLVIEKIDGQVSDGMGGLITNWVLFKNVSGYLDLLTGTDENTSQNASVEDSTHILIITNYVDGITNQMRVIDEESHIYTVTYSDNPVGIKHHNEVYMKFGGDVVE